MFFNLFKKKQPSPKSPSSVKSVAATPNSVDINEIEDIDRLAHCCNQASSTSEKKQCIQRICHLHQTNRLKQEEINSQINENKDRQQIALQIGDEAALNLLCEFSKNDFIHYALQAFSAQARLTAFNQINELEDIKTIAAASKGKDKSIFRSAQKMLQEAELAQQQAQQIQADINAPLEQISKLSTTAYYPQYAAKLRLIVQQWQALTSHADTAITQMPNR